jgi:magnesium chelatase subunit D
MDAALAARLVLSPRATQIPMSPEQSSDESEGDSANEPTPSEENQDHPNEPSSDEDSSDQETNQAPPSELPNDLDELVLEAAKAAIPAGLLSQLLLGQGRIAKGSGSGKSGALKKGGHRGRPMGSRQGVPGGHQRLSVIDTLRAAAPWQRIRHSMTQGVAASVVAHDGQGRLSPRLVIRSEDFRIKRFKERAETTTIFAIDASGSAALHRLAEAKGAIELLLADCYVRRDQVAVIAFRGRQAEIILPPTRSLVRAKRGLAGLPGGGGTPLSLAIDACRDLAASVARKGETPLVVILTDGKANITRDGQPGREQAQQEVREAARVFATSGVAAMVIDTSPQPSELARDLAAEMRARYMLLPHAAANQLSQAVRTMSVK